MRKRVEKRRKDGKKKEGKGIEALKKKSNK